MRAFVICNKAWNNTRPAQKLQGGPNITVNLFCIWLNEKETCTYADAVQICGNI